MRKIQLLLVALFAVVGSAMAAIPTTGDVGYLYNSTAKRFLNANVSGDGTGILFKARNESDGSYSTVATVSEFDDAIYNYVRFEQNDKSGTWLRVEASSMAMGSGYHKFAVTETEDGLLIRCIYQPSQVGYAVQGAYLAFDENGTLVLAEEKSYWQFVPEGDDYATLAAAAQADYEDWLAAKENAAAQATKDALAAMNEGAGPQAGDELLAILFPNAGFDASNNADGCNVTMNGGNNPSYKVENGNCGLTKYQGTLKVEKTIKGLPAGWYTLKAQAFGRKGNFATNKTKFEAGEELETPGVIFANGVTKQVPNAFDGLIDESDGRTFKTSTKQDGRFDIETPSVVQYFGQVTVDGVNKYVLDNSNSGSYVFSLGEYQVELIVYLAEGEALTFGFDKTTADTDDYCGCDNFELIYEGDAMPQTFADGKYYLYNPASGKFWGAGNDWGTRASLVDHAEFITLHYAATGYTFESQVSNGGTSYYFGGDYMDGGAKSLFIVPFGKYYKVYANDAVYGYDGTSTILGKNVEGDAAAWQIFSEEDMKAQLAKATAKEPVDATWMLLDPNFGRNNRNSSTWQGSFGKGGDNTNMNAEKYMGTFDVFQELTVPNGLYAVQASAAVTYHDNRTLKDYDGEGAPVIYANDETADFFEMAQDDKLSNQGQMSSQFGAGVYRIEPIYVEVTDGVLMVGAKSERADIWAVWDNFEIKYYGPDATVLEAKAAQAVEDYQKALAEAQKVDQTKIEVEAVKTALADALAAYPEETVLAEGATKESIEAATAALAAATDAATASIIAADILPKMLAFTETTNVYTQDALDAYYTQYYEKYVAGTLTAEEARVLQDPNAGTGWHASITVDNFLLSAWDTNPDFNNAPYYINTWSVEGNSDGSGFYVPFFEYWTDDANSLGEKTLTATMTDLPNGQYEVSAWVRVRAKNETAAADATGITLQVNDAEEVVDVTEGEPVGDSQFNIAEYIAKGDVVDGTLKIKFIVAADNNISWLSFKNVKFEKVSDATKIAGVTEKAAQKAIFNAAGQQMKNLQKGINIVDGAKVYVK